MSCEGHSSKDGSDSLEVGAVSRPFDGSATAWLLGQAVRHLNTADKEGEFAYAQVVEVLRRCSGDLLETMHGLFRQAKGGDSDLRWNLLYVLGDVGDEKAVDFLQGVALNALPDVRPDAGCETERDTEILVCTMAVHGLHRVATRYPNAAEGLLKVVAAKPARPILIEAVKVAVDLGLKERVLHLLPKEDHWILDIRRAKTQEMFADPEREDGKERGFTPPKSGSLYTAPSVVRCSGKEN